uniref:Uncharacterized protein n=1 Tax=Molossus molossus TaxID=27622 RepID=A0A7J8I9D7_MOLMO|nr:hypothetical protein HJG59_010715 [Molossus molossus]
MMGGAGRQHLAARCPGWRPTQRPLAGPRAQRTTGGARRQHLPVLGWTAGCAGLRRLWAQERALERSGRSSGPKRGAPVADGPRGAPSLRAHDEQRTGPLPRGSGPAPPALPLPPAHVPAARSAAGWQISEVISNVLRHRETVWNGWSPQAAMWVTTGDISGADNTGPGAGSPSLVVAAEFVEMEGAGK